MSIGTGISMSAHSLAMTIMPLVTGYFMGKKATQQNIYDCCWFLFGFQCLGVACSLILLLTERTYKRDLVMVEKDRLRYMECFIELEMMIKDSNAKEQMEGEAANKKCFLSTDGSSTELDTEEPDSPIMENK